jgi:hypothetical protein
MGRDKKRTDLTRKKCPPEENGGYLYCPQCGVAINWKDIEEAEK